MERISLNGAWQGACIGEHGDTEFAFCATVPGCVHTDLMGSRLPRDIYYRDNGEACRWVEDKDWKFTRTFHLEEVLQDCWLHFEGLDTYADITLNGVHLGSTDNMFISHRFAVSSCLKSGDNTLQVYFRSPIRTVADKAPRKGAFTTERLYTRRMQCTYGWDWVARFVTCGIFKEVWLETDPGFGVEHVYIYTAAVVEGVAQLVAEGQMTHWESGGLLELRVTDPEGNCVYRDSRYCAEPSWKLHIDLPDARLWYPAGYGEQPIYTLHIGDKAYPFGIRTVALLQIPDAPGSEYYNRCLRLQSSKSGQRYDRNTEFSGFELYVNGKKIFCQGANWVPCEPFPSAVTARKITTLLRLAKQAGVNMLRVWGGGIFECGHFYDSCDRLGILVTQDFLMACGHYPEEDDAFIAQLNREAEYAAYKLRNHPCLVWWSGDNENAVCGSDEMTDYRGRNAVCKGLLPVIRRLDPQRRFLLSSPFGGRLYASKTVGTTHNTQFMGCELFPYVRGTDMADYKEELGTYLARFIAEEPSFGAVSLPSLLRFMESEDICCGDEMWQYHTKGNPALRFTLFELLLDFAQKVLGPFRDGQDRYFKLKYAQYEWVRISMENARRNEGFLNGMIYWMWNDCWPAAAGWAFVDYYCLPKASYYSFKRCAGDFLVSLQKEGYLTAYVCCKGIAGEVALTLRRLEASGATVLSEKTVTAAPGQPVCKVSFEAVDPEGVFVCDAVCGQRRDRAFWKAGHLHMVPAPVPTVIGQTDSAITLQAESYIHAVELEGEYIFADNYFSLLPGEKRSVSFRPAEDAQSEELRIGAYTIK